jgi:hypothetical protein
VEEEIQKILPAERLHKEIPNKRKNKSLEFVHLHENQKWFKKCFHFD